MSTPDIPTEEERLEAELAEQARVSSGDWDSVKPGKAQNFGQSFRRMIGLLAPHKWSFAFASLLGALIGKANASIGRMAGDHVHGIVGQEPVHRRALGSGGIGGALAVLGSDGDQHRLHQGRQHRTGINAP